MTCAYDSATALLVVDVQNDFADPAGGLYVQGGEEIIDAVNVEIAAAIEAGSAVVYSQDWHPESTPHFAKDGGIWPVHCVMDTWGAELYTRLDVRGPVVRKGSAGEDGYSAFSMRDPLSGATTPTELQSLLTPTIRRLVIVGLAGDYCVKQTAMDGRRLGYDVVIPLRHTRFVNLSPGDDERAAASMRDAGAELI
jgi:nicotinamidase/pyrazinamidase